MKRSILLAICIFIFFILIFLIQKVIFVIAHGSANGGVSITELLHILYHGLPLDLSVSGYLSVIPMLLLTVSVWIKPACLRKLSDGYFFVILLLLALAVIVDTVLYAYWGFHFDAAVFLYLRKPKEAFASASASELALGIAGSALLFMIFYAGYAFTLKKMFRRLPQIRYRRKAAGAAVLFLLTGALFLPIRGGVTVSTMNIGYAYFSERMFLNHAAVNPVFNLLYSLSKSEDFASQYQFYPADRAECLFEALHKQIQGGCIPRLLNTARPNIILCMLESFSFDAATDSIVAPCMHGFAKEGILFENFYANSFRTDRGIVSILSGYPSQPTVALLKYPQKTATLPTLPKSLREAGYKNQSMYYGGDINFANMRSYFVGSCGIEDLISDRDFPLKQRLTKWGVPDKYLLERVCEDLTREQSNTPFFKTVLTLSSHEPFDVPVTQFDVPFLNSVKYTDEQLGAFVARLKWSGIWDNALIIFLADHAMQKYPRGFDNSDPVRFHIPMIWIGGAVKQPSVITAYCSQNDLAATLLSQLDMNYEGYKFSKDMLNPESRKFAFYSYMNGFCMIDSAGIFTFDNDQEKILKQTGRIEMEMEAKAFFQMTYLDLGSR
ncbi:MAG: LTA synthase family protein [Tannerella sp.]|jgi:phosphoglycerol transferase MdoB-like AlkP superfamily enzyme|nr:LTA synthase family protein [Tannerella sp.]